MIPLRVTETFLRMMHDEDDLLLIMSNDDDLVLIMNNDEDLNEPVWALRPNRIKIEIDHPD